MLMNSLIHVHPDLNLLMINIMDIQGPCQTHISHYFITLLLDLVGIDILTLRWCLAPYIIQTYSNHVKAQ